MVGKVWINIPPPSQKYNSIYRDELPPRRIFNIIYPLYIHTIFTFLIIYVYLLLNIVYLYLFKVILLLYIMEKSDNKLTTEEKAEIFEHVNSLYLKLTGQKKKQTKASFKTSWKEDNLLYIMMVKLNDVYDMWCEHECNEEWTWERDNVNMEGTISRKKHNRIINMMRESERDLELELEKIQEGKGYMSEEQHEQEMKEALINSQQADRVLQDRAAKYRNEADMLREKLDHANKRLEAQKLYYEDQMKKLNT